MFVCFSFSFLFVFLNSLSSGNSCREVTVIIVFFFYLHEGRQRLGYSTALGDSTTRRLVSGFLHSLFRCGDMPARGGLPWGGGGEVENPPPARGREVLFVFIIFRNLVKRLVVTLVLCLFILFHFFLNLILLIRIFQMASIATRKAFLLSVNSKCSHYFFHVTYNK